MIRFVQKDIFTAYFFLFIGGFFGLHLIYLERDAQAVVYWMTCGGGFGLACIYDLFKMRSYIADVNREWRFLRDQKNEMRRRPKPPNKGTTLIVQIAVGMFFGRVVSLALPGILGEIGHRLCPLLIPLSAATGVYLFGNIGNQKGRFIYPMIGAYMVFPLREPESDFIVYTSVFAAGAFDLYAKQWRRGLPERKTQLQRFTFLFISGIISAVLVGSAFLHGFKIVTDDGEQLKLKDALKHFFTSPLWKETHGVVKEAMVLAQEHGWDAVHKHIIKALDPEGELNALQVLGLNKTATESNITIVYHKLVRKYHPDKHLDPGTKAIARVKFIEIQEAYGLLSCINSKRAIRNTEHQK